MKSYIQKVSLSLLIVSSITACGGGSDSTEIAIDVLEPPTNSAPIPTLSVTLLAAPEPTTQQSFATFEFEADGNTGFTCLLNGELLSTCASPLTVMPLTLGMQNLIIRAKNQESIEGPETSFDWEVSTVFASGQNASIHNDLIRTTMMPDAAAPNSWKGIFRINCDFAHASYNDPVVFPGEENAAHLHRFYGNTLTDHNSTNESLFTQGESTCQGNLLNLSSYWVPSIITPEYDQQTLQPVLDANGDQKFVMVPAVVGNDDVAHEIFYYSAGIDDLAAIQAIPVGLRMIAGSHMSQPGQEQDTSIVRWHCQSWASDDSSNPQWSTSIPVCEAPDRVRMDIFFPSCWNGTDLDSDDHKSHMAYPVDATNGNAKVCPSTHPIALVRPSYHYAFGVKPEVYDPATRSSIGWRLSSDMYTVDEQIKGGNSLHADWVNAWHPEVMQALLDNCIKEGLDCHDGNLANGFRLNGTQPGTQAQPDIIKGAM
jgi:hypothetical protein